ncbi:hypothetical protein SAMN05444392_102234 [Seinonella peptonophila]|uniref:DUF3679 domain-containing protein n=2 Tax=Seinonella peptonophila TaxID=112248 RepID=A0A1M4V8U7_9BACL|nr:hypothetical protein SAMN05444392_102234 [Seinonella peptonophila]
MLWIGVSMVAMLCVGVFVGIDSAEKNIHKLQGAEGAPRAIQITPQNGKVEIALLGNVVTTQNPAKAISPKQVIEAKKQVQGKTNQLAQLGNQVGSGIRQSARKLLSVIFGWID